MAGNIKGMTIEIGGNTAPLEQSLKGVNKEIKTTQNELTQVNKLLKLDPTNTELLKQKQQLLATQIGSTTTKLDALKQAQAKLDAEIKKGGNVNQEEYRKLEREIATTESSLKKLKEEAKNTHPHLAKVGKALQDVGSVAGTLAKGTLDLTIQGVKTLGAVSLACATGMWKLATSSGALADDLNTLASQTGLSTQQLQEFQFASDVIDVSIETLSGALKKTTSSMVSAQSGTGKTADAFKKLGVSVTNADGSLRNNNDVFNEAIRALGNVANETERDALAMQLFGKSATELNPLIEGGIDTLEELTMEVNDLGLVLSQDALDGANAFNDQLDILKATAKATINVIGTEIASKLTPSLRMLRNISETYIQEMVDAVKNGTLEDVAKTFSGILGDIISKITKGLPKVAKLGTQIVTTFVDAIKKNATEIGKAGGELITTLAEGFWEILPSLLETAVLLVTSFIQTIGEKLPDLIPIIIDGILKSVDAIVDNIDIIIDAGLQLFTGLAQGLEKAIPTLLAKIPVVIQKVGTALIENLPKIIEAVGQIIVSVANTIGQSVDQLVPPLIECILTLIDVIIENLPLIIETMFKVSSAISDALIDNIDLIIDAGIQLIVGLAKGLIQAIPKLVEKLPEIINAIVNGLMNLIGKIADVGINLLYKLGESIINGLYILGEAIVAIWNKIKEGLTEQFEGIKQVGSNLVQGLWNGIKDMKEWLKNKIKSLGSLIIDAFKEVLGISSPSRVMADEVGKYMAEGIGLGFDKKMPSVIDEMQSKLTSVVGAMQTEFALGDIPAIEGNKIVSENQYITKNYSNTVETIRQPQTVELVLDGTKVARTLIRPLNDEYNRLGLRV